MLFNFFQVADVNATPDVVGTLPNGIGGTEFNVGEVITIVIEWAFILTDFGGKGFDDPYHFRSDVGCLVIGFLGFFDGDFIPDFESLVG